MKRRPLVQKTSLESVSYNPQHAVTFKQLITLKSTWMNAIHERIPPSSPPEASPLPSMSRSRKVTKHPRFRDFDAWEALRRRDLKYAINLLIAGEWIIGGAIKDGQTSLDAKFGSERCHETALLALILRVLWSTI
jgi:hypothetical protein